MYVFLGFFVLFFCFLVVSLDVQKATKNYKAPKQSDTNKKNKLKKKTINEYYNYKPKTYVCKFKRKTYHKRKVKNGMKNNGLMQEALCQPYFQ